MFRPALSSVSQLTYHDYGGWGGGVSRKGVMAQRLSGCLRGERRVWKVFRESLAPPPCAPLDNAWPAAYNEVASPKSQVGGAPSTRRGSLLEDPTGLFLTVMSVAK